MIEKPNGDETKYERVRGAPVPKVLMQNIESDDSKEKQKSFHNHSDDRTILLSYLIGRTLPVRRPTLTEGPDLIALHRRPPMGDCRSLDGMECEDTIAGKEKG